jgi:hypothetical protein
MSSGRATRSSSASIVVLQASAAPLSPRLQWILTQLELAFGPVHQPRLYEASPATAKLHQCYVNILSSQGFIQQQQLDLLRYLLSSIPDDIHGHRFVEPEYER